MFDENKFRDTYKEEYHKLSPKEDSLKQLKEYSLAKKHYSAWHYLRPIVAALGVFCLVSVISMPVLASVSSVAYERIAEIAPGLADYILPIKMADTKMGITMQVEAMQVEGNTGELVVSFADEAGSGKNLISGKVDMYDSYTLQSYGCDSNVGGCSFIEYDEETGKAYFKISVLSENEFDKTKLKFSVRQLLVEDKEYEMQLDTDMLVMDPPLKESTINGKSGGQQALEAIADYFYKTVESFPLYSSKVMDLAEPEECMKDTIQVTGIGYVEGLLRVQICRGTFADADRHGTVYIVDGEGLHRAYDCSVSWQEELDGEKVLLEEQWFLVSEEELDDLQLYAKFYETAGCIEGNWKVTANLENNSSVMIMPVE